jgi:AAA+ ATPase superfamily predicted ATPase
MSDNPFVFGNPVKGKDFYDREAETEIAIGFIRNSQSFSIIGERRIGKTSFLEHILSEETFKNHNLNPEEYIIVLFNLSSLCEITKNSIIRAILEKVEHLCVETESENVFDRFKIFVESIPQRNKKLIVAFDEFELVAPVLDSHFSYWLRYIFQTQNVAAITCSRSTVRELEEFGGSASPLFNIFGNIFLKLFKREEAKKMIIDMFLKGKMGLEGQEVSFIADLSGGNPYFIQLIGYFYHEERKSILALDINRIAFMNLMIAQLTGQFESYWKHLIEEEKNCLMNIIKSRELPKPKLLSVPNLERKGLIIIENNGIKIFSPLFREFMQRKNLQGVAVIQKMEKKILESTGKFDMKLQGVALAVLGLLLAVLAEIFSDVAIAFLREVTKNYSEFPERFLSLFINSIPILLAIFSVLYLVFLIRLKKRIES